MKFLLSVLFIGCLTLGSESATAGPRVWANGTGFINRCVGAACYAIDPIGGRQVASTYSIAQATQNALNVCRVRFGLPRFFRQSFPTACYDQLNAYRFVVGVRCNTRVYGYCY